MKRSVGLSGSLAAGGAVLLLNSAVLAVAPSASLWYIGNVVLHPLLGLGLTGAALCWLRRQGWPTGALARLAVVLTAAGVASGMAVVGAAAVGAMVLHRSPVLLDLHVWLSVLGAALVGL